MAFSINSQVVAGFWLLAILGSEVQCFAVDDDYRFLQADVDPGSQRQRRQIHLRNGSKLVFSIHFQRPISKFAAMQLSLPAAQFSNQIQLPENLDSSSFAQKPQKRPSGRRNYEPALRGISDSREDAIITKLRLSLTIRDNLVNVFGYILYQSTKTLDLNRYASLVDIYKGLQAKRVRTNRILPSLPTIAYKNPQEQYIEVFRVLRKEVPIYLRGAVDIWTSSLTNKSVDLNAILRPNNGPLVADLFAGIDLALMPQLNIRTRFTDGAKRRVTKYTSVVMGHFLGSILGGLTEGSIKVTRQIVALIMLHTPLYRNIAEVEEAQRYLADVLLANDSSNLEFAIQHLDETTRENSYLLIRRVLTNIVQAKNVDPAVKECAEIILPHFIPLNVITLNPNYNSIVPIVKNLKIDFDELFKHITTRDYPDDIVKIKNMLVLAIAKKELNMAPIMKGFVIHDYTTPADMIIAVLDRIWRRGTSSIPLYLKDSLRALIIHVKMKVATLTRDAKTYESLNDIRQILNVFFTPQTSDEIKLLIRGIVESLSAEQISWKAILGELRPGENSRPKQYIKRLFEHILNLKVVKNTDLMKRLNDWVSYTDTAGEPKDCPRIDCVDNNPVHQVTTEPPPVATQRPTLEPREIRKTPADVDIGQLLSSILITAQDLPNILKIQNYITSTFTKYFPTFDMIPYKTSGDLLKALFKKYLAYADLQKDPDMYQLFKRFNKKIQLTGLGARPIPWIEVIIVKSVDMTSVLKALRIDAVEKDGKSEFLEQLYDFLMNEYRQQDFSSGFEFQEYYTRGTFLKGFFNHIINYPDINPKVRDAFMALEYYIQLDGPGEDPVDYTQ